jgi:hypothetical protein
MTVHDDDRPGDDGVHPATPARRSRGLVVAGVIGLAAVLGGGSYLITDHLRGGDDKGATTSIGRIDSVETSDAPSAEASAPASTQPSAAAAPASATAAPSPAPAATLTSPTDAAKVKKEIQAAREKAAKDGYPLQRPLQDKGQPVEADTRMEKYAGGTMRITTAKGDLTGQKDQLMAGDAGVPVGAARCTSVRQCRQAPGDPHGRALLADLGEAQRRDDGRRRQGRQAVVRRGRRRDRP